MTLSVLGGRALVFSPHWTDEGVSVLFDTNSGDYWALTPLAREIVSHATEAGSAETSALVSFVVSRATSLEGIDADETTIRRVIDELVQLAILAHT